MSPSPGDRIAYVGPHAPGSARERLDAHGKAVAPGFVNMLAHPEESLLADGRALSDLRQGVTLEVLGEDSMGPLTPRNEASSASSARATSTTRSTGPRSASICDKLEQRGIAPNVASFVGAGTVRTNVLGERDVQPTAAQLAQMRSAGAPGHGAGRARRDHRAHLQPQRVRQDPGADRARERVGALRRHLQRAHAQRR